jgi:hypothetical protein
MSVLMRYLGACALAALVVSAAALGLAGLGPCGLDPASLHELADRLGRERARREILLQQSRASLARVFARARLARDLAEERITLLEAAAGCRELASAGFHWDEFRRQYPDADSDEERFCLQVIDGAEVLLRWEGRTAEADRLTERLKAELRERKRHGPLRLPEAPPPGEARDE